jgi:hypothetical protein
MNSLRRCAQRAALTLLLAATSPWPLVAQVAVTPTAGQTSRETVVLSPFTVNTDRDSGFVAASSLAGGRLATDLADMPPPTRC